MNNQFKKVAVTGFYGTGSSAVLDLLKEYRNAHAIPEIGRPYEHTTFYVSGGLFDLCTLLTHGNAPLQSDYVMNNFVDAMHRLNDYNYLWFGSFKALTGDRFMEAVDRFVNAISTHHPGKNYNHCLRTRFSPTKACMQFAAKLIYGRKFSRYGVGYVWDNKPVYYANPTEKELYAAARRFTNDFFELFASENTELDIYDHLIWPQQVDSHKDCFDNDFKIIIVDRDPRDIYISDQFIWSVPPMGRGVPHFSKNIEEFIEEWKRTVSPRYTNPNSLRIQFEDLVYNYESTVERIENFIGLENNAHIKIKGTFLPEKSIENTQVFMLKPEWEEIADTIAKIIPECIYEFPYTRCPDKKKIFP